MEPLETIAGFNELSDEAKQVIIDYVYNQDYCSTMMVKIQIENFILGGDY